MQEDKDMIQNEDPEKEIDLLELGMTLWKQRRKLLIWSLCGALLGLIVAFSIPKEYATTVKLAPESSDGKSGGGLGAFASLVGIGEGKRGADALYPQLYPDVVSSVPFVTGLFDVKVKRNDEDNSTTTVREFLENDTKGPWWGSIIGLPSKILELFSGGDDDEAGIAHTVNNFQLTPKESALVEALNGRVSAAVDPKTLVITINVKMQDPIVSAMLADTVTRRLQDFVTDYRTTKARHDLEYVQTLNKEAKENYYKAQQAYANYLDRNQGMTLHSAQTVRDRLENEATLAFNLYNQTSQQVQAAQAKVQENTPVFATVAPATVPVRATSPRKLQILVGFTFLAFVACAAWILFLQPIIEERKKKVADKASKS